MSTHHPIVPAHADPIRIVPLYVPDTVTGPPVLPVGEVAEIHAAAAPPHLTYRGGPLLANVKIFTIFWGAGWATGTLHTLAGNLNKFFQYIVTSPLIDQLGEYSVPHYHIGHGSFLGSITVSSPAPSAAITDAAIQHLVQQEISTNHAVPKPDANTLYFVYTPPGSTITQGGSRSCQAFCGYHSNIGNQIFYAAMPYPGCSGCTGGLSVQNALTATSSHELCEAITDAIPGTGWYDDQHGEIGDICAWQFDTLGGYTIQKEWSNAANACK